MATVVGRGMRWSDELFEKAVKNHYYIKIGGKGGELLLSGAERQWKKPATAEMIYLPALRVAGLPADITQFLLLRRVEPQQVQDYLKYGYTKDNTAEGGELEKQFAAELEALQRFKAAKAQVQAAQPQMPAFSLETLAAWVAALPKAKAVEARTGAEATARPASPKRGGRKKPLIERLRTAQAAGKVLDVSNIDNVKMVERPKGKTAKIGPAGVPVVSSSFENFVSAMRQLGPEYEKYIPQYQNLMGTRMAPIAPVIAAPRVPSPQAAAAPRVPSPQATVARVPSPRQAVVPVIPELPALAPLPSPRATATRVPAIPTLGVAPLPTLGVAPLPTLPRLQVPTSPRGGPPVVPALPRGLPTIPR